MWQPFGKVGAVGFCTCVVSSPGAMPGGSFAGSLAASATANRSTMRSVPTMRNVAVAELDVGGGRFQQVRGDLLALVDDLERRLVQRRAADGQRARAAGQAARRAIAVAVDDVDPVGIDAEPVGDDLLVGR